LTRAAHTAQAARLFGTKANPRGLFDAEAGLTRRAWLRAQDEGWLQMEPRARSGQPRLVHLTAGGLRQLLRLTPSEERPHLLRSSDPAHQPGLVQAWIALSGDSSEAWLSDYHRLEKAAGTRGISLSVSAPAAPPPPPQAPAGADFKRTLAHELVISWKFTPNEEAKRGIARALQNSGVQQIGKQGEQVEFVGRHHRCEDAVFPGDQVIVVEPGWMVHDGIGEFLLEKAVVRPV